MVKLLNETYAKIDPMKMEYYSNTMRAEHYRSLLQNSTTVNDQMTNKVYYAYELLGAGKNEQSVKEFEELLAAGQKSGITAEFLFTVKRMLALAYIRLGEEMNCIQQFNEASCIMPIKGDGVYGITQASRAAIRLYEELLAEKPDHYESLWMLNFAYMTLGEYPDKVPAKRLFNRITRYLFLKILPTPLASTPWGCPVVPVWRISPTMVCWTLWRLPGGLKTSCGFS